MTVLAQFPPNGSTTGVFTGIGATLRALAPANNPPGNFPWIVLYNYSAYLVEVTIGSSQNWLQPATAAAFDVPQSGSSVQLEATSNPSGAVVNTGQIQGVWYAAPDGVPIGFPLPLPSPLGVADVNLVSPVPLPVSATNLPVSSIEPFVTQLRGDSHFIGPSVALTTFTDETVLFVAGGNGMVLWHADLSQNAGATAYGQMGIDGMLTICSVNAQSPSDHWESGRGVFIASGTQILSFTTGDAAGFTADVVYDQL